MKLRPLIIGFSALLATSAMAQDGFLGQSGAPIDTSLPIEVAADALEVIQSEQLAVFTGNVDAVQGEMRLQADLLRVHYSSGGGAGGEITMLDAEGNVHVSSPRETARGDTAIYNVLEEQVTMQGNVVLAQGDNVIQGSRLTIDLATGHSRIDGGDTVVSTGGSSSGDGRVRGVFTIPSDDAPASNTPPAEEPAEGAADE